MYFIFSKDLIIFFYEYKIDGVRTIASLSNISYGLTYFED